MVFKFLPPPVLIIMQPNYPPPFIYGNLLVKGHVIAPLRLFFRERKGKRYELGKLKSFRENPIRREINKKKGHHNQDSPYM